MPARGCGGQGGRIFPHQQDADFTGEVLGDNIHLEENHIEQVQETKQFSLDIDTKKNHQNWIKHIYNYWEQHFPAYYRVGVQTLTDEELNNSTSFIGKIQKVLYMKGSTASSSKRL